MLMKQVATAFAPADELLSLKLYRDLIYHVIIALIAIFTAKAFYTFKKMILYQKTVFVLKSWTVFEILVLTLVVFNFFSFRYFQPFNYILILLTTIGGLVVSLNMKWVAYLNFNQKWRSILLLLIVFLIAFSFIEFIYNQSSTLQSTIYDSYDHHGIYNDLGTKIFFICIFLFITFYCMSSILVLLFNLPTSSVFEQKIGEIFSIQQLSETIKLTNNESEIYQSLIDTSFVATFSDAVWLEVVDNENQFVDFKNLHIDKYDIFELKKALKKEGHNLKKNIISIKDLSSLKYLDKSKYKSCLVIPLNSSSQYLGSIGFLKETKDSFNNESIDIATTLAHQASTAIANSRLLVEEIKTEQYKKELKIASDVKKKLLPPIPVLSEKFDSYVKSNSADEVGGDFFSAGTYTENTFFFVIADISGHGTSAAFNMAQLKGAFEALLPLQLTSDELLKSLNAALSKCLEKTSFISLTLVFIHTDTNEVEINRAGHCPTLFFNSKKEIESIQGRGLGLGILRNETYSQHIAAETRKVDKDDILFLYTDGLVESTNDKNEEYGMERISNVLMNNSHLSSSEIVSNSLKSLNDFCGDTPITDDVTCLVIKFN